MWRRDRRFVGLLLLAAIPAAVESTVLTGIGFEAAQGLSPQLTAVWPYDTYHDLRWLLAYHDTWLGFVVEWLAIVLGRGLLSAALVALAWPKEVPRPAFHRLAVRNLAVAAAASVLLSPWAALSLAASVIALSWYLFAALIPLLLLAPFLQRAGAMSGWWRGLPSIELVGWSMLNFVLLTVAGAFIWSVPGWLNVPATAAAGLANGLLWQRTVRAAVLPHHRRWRRVPVVPIAIALTLLGPAAARNVAGARPGAPAEWQAPILTQKLPATVHDAVIAVAGHDSSYAGEAAVDPNVERFSYQGLDAQGRPSPYEPRATHRSLESVADLLAAQVEGLHRRTGRPVALIGQSEGAIVVRLYLERRRDSVVDTALLFSPPVLAGRSYYPPKAADAGWGLVAGWEIRGLLAIMNLTSSAKDNPDEPFVRSLLENAPFYRNRTLCPVPGVRMIAFVPTVTAAEAPPGEYTRIPVFQLPAFHGGVLGRPVIQHRLVGFLAGEMLNQTRREYTLLQRLAAAWQAPPLVISVNPVWRSFRENDPAFTGRICQPG